MLSVRADDKTMTLNSASLPTLTASYSGFKNGETLTTSGVTGSPSLTTTATPSSPVGPYTITAALGSLTATNYTFTLSNGTLSIQYASGGTCYGDVGHTILQPIDADGTSVFKKGSTVPAKFRVCDAGGNSVGTSGVVSSFKLTATVSGTAVAYPDEDVYSTTPDTAFRWSSTDQLWIFNINTKNSTASKTYIYTITLNDGTIINGTTANATPASFQYGLR